VATGAMATVIEACGFDIVIVETVGVGQTELQIMIWLMPQQSYLFPRVAM